MKKKCTKEDIEQKYSEQKEEMGLKEKSIEPEISKVCNQSVVVSTNCPKIIISYK